MAIKVDEKNILYVDVTSEEILDAKDKMTALSLDDYKKYLYEINGKTLFITDGIHTTTVINASKLKYIRSEGSDFQDIILEGVFNNIAPIIVNPSSLSVKGATVYNDFIDVSIYDNELTKKDKNNHVVPKEPADKGFTVDSGKGNDVIVGSMYSDTLKGNAGKDIIDGNSGNDTISGGDGDDTITGGLGNDKLSGGKGADKFIFNQGDGLDTITDADNTDTVQIDVDPENTVHYGKNGKNLEIFYDEGFDDNEKIIVQNYFNSNKNKPAIFVNDEETAVIDYSIVGKGTINGTKERDDIVGSNSNDTIKEVGGRGNTVTGRGGNDNLYGGTTADSRTTFIFNPGDGKDVVNSGKGEDTLQFNNVNLSDIIFEQGTQTTTRDIFGQKIQGSNKDLIIKYTEDDQVTVKNFYTVDAQGKITGINPNNSVKHLIVNGENVVLGGALYGTADKDYLRTHYNNSIRKIFANAGNDELNVYIDNTMTYGEAGNDDIRVHGVGNTIYGGKGNDYINLGVNSYDYPEGGQNTIVFNKGDGQDKVYSWGDEKGSALLKFADSTLSDLTFEKYGNALKINYNSGKDSVLVEYYYEDYSPKCQYLVADKNGLEVDLDEYLSDIEVPESTDTKITGTSGDDYIRTQGNNNIAVVDGAAGNDEIDVDIDDTTVYGGAGNDDIRVHGVGNTIYGGKGNDYMNFGVNSYEYPEGGQNTVVFNKGDGQDTVYSWGDAEGSAVLKFADSNLSDLTFEKYGNALKINYNSGKDSVILEYYYEDYSPKNPFLVVDKNGAEKTLEDLIEDYTTVPESSDTEIIGTSGNDQIYACKNTDIIKIDAGAGNDYIVPVNGATVYCGDGDDELYSIDEATAYGLTIYGGAGNDRMVMTGSDNVINGGVGNDNFTIFNYDEETENVFTFNNGDGQDSLNSSGKSILLFNDTLMSELKVEDFVYEPDKLRIKYNSGADSITVYGQPDNITLVDKIGKEQTLTDFIEQYGTEQGTTPSELVGTEGYDALSADFGSNVSSINAKGGNDYIRVDKKYTTAYGGKGNDSIIIMADNAIVYGEEGSDNITINSNENTIFGGKGSDTISLYGEENYLSFSNGDGNDILTSYQGNNKLKFLNTELKDIKLEKSGDCLKIKYNAGADSILIRDFYDEENPTNVEYTLIDKSGRRITLADFIKEYGTIPISTQKELNGTEQDDNLRTYENEVIKKVDGKGGNDNIRVDVDNVTVLGGAGNDFVSVTASGTTVDGGVGNDELYVVGENNTIHGGKGNDFIGLIEYYEGEEQIPSSSIITFNNGDGQDTVMSWSEGEKVLQFKDSLMSDIKLEKYGTALKIKYNLGKDSVLLQNYYSDYGDYYDYTIMDKNGVRTSIEDFMKMPVSTDTKITGTSGDDYIKTHKNNNIAIVDGAAGNDEIDVDIDDTTVYGGAGNDDIHVQGVGNTIYGGKGNDYMNFGVNSYEYPEGGQNTIIFNKGDGQDTVYSWGDVESSAVLKFADSNLSDLTFEKYGDALKINYNSGKDSIILEYFYEDYTPKDQYIVVDKNNKSILLNSNDEMDKENINELNQNILSWNNTGSGNIYYDDNQTNIPQAEVIACFNNA